jgi:addiction module HigA family antidote
MPEFKAGPRTRKPTHPGAIVKRELEALGMTVYAAAPLLGVSKQALGNIVDEKSRVSPEMALRLGKFFGNGPQLWMDLQTDHDLHVTLQKVHDIIREINTVKPEKRSA